MAARHDSAPGRGACRARWGLVVLASSGGPDAFTTVNATSRPVMASTGAPVRRKRGPGHRPGPPRVPHGAAQCDWRLVGAGRAARRNHLHRGHAEGLAHRRARRRPSRGSRRRAGRRSPPRPTSRPPRSGGSRAPRARRPTAAASFTFLPACAALAMASCAGAWPPAEAGGVALAPALAPAPLAPALALGDAPLSFFTLASSKLPASVPAFKQPASLTSRSSEALAEGLGEGDAVGGVCGVV